MADFVPNQIVRVKFPNGRSEDAIIEEIFNDTGTAIVRLREGSVIRSQRVPIEWIYIPVSLDELYAFRQKVQGALKKGEI